MTKKALFIESEKIINDTEQSFKFLETYLGLKEPLKGNYSLFEYTGVPGYGDPSDVIKKGEIIRQKKDYSNIRIPSEILEQAKKSYDSCRSILLEHCITID